MEEKIIQRKYKQKYTAWWIFSIYNFILAGLLISKAIQLKNKFGEPQDMGWIILLVLVMAIISFIGILTDRADPKSYIEIELTGDVVKSQTSESKISTPN